MSERHLTPDEEAMYAANRKVRSYVGSIQDEQGGMHPEWMRLLEEADFYRKRVEAAQRQAYERSAGARMKRAIGRVCPTCGRSR